MEIVDIALSGSSSGAYAMVLGEVGGSRKLPIVIGGSEAQAIAIEMEKMKASRPLTHDLFRNAFEVFGLKVTEVLIYNMVEGIFYAKLICSDGVREEEVDARPSDGVALAYRFNAPIRCYESVLDAAGIRSEDLERDEDFEEEEEERVMWPMRVRSARGRWRNSRRSCATPSSKKTTSGRRACGTKSSAAREAESGRTFRPWTSQLLCGWASSWVLPAMLPSSLKPPRCSRSSGWGTK